MSGLWTNHSFEPMIFFRELDKSVQQIGLNYLKQLLNQNSLSDAWQSLWLKMNHNSAVFDPVKNEQIQKSSSSNIHWTEESVQPRPKTDKLLICACVNLTLEWRGKIKVFNGFSMFMLKRWSDEDVIDFRHIKLPCFTSFVECFNNIIEYMSHHCMII